MRPRTIAALGILTGACGATFPEVTKREVPPNTLPAKLPGIEPCILLGESVDRSLFKESTGFVALTHAHWDHAGGIPDLPEARILLWVRD